MEAEKQNSDLKEKLDSLKMMQTFIISRYENIGAVFGSARSVNISALVEMVDDEKCIFLVVHNHPSDKPFSPRDLSTFISIPNMAILIVLGNNGSIYTIEKTDNMLIEEGICEIRKLLINYRNNLLTFSDIVKKLEIYGIKYSVA